MDSSARSPPSQGWAADWKQQLRALLALNFLAARRQPAYFLGGIFFPIMMIGIAIGMSAAFQSSTPSVVPGTRVSVPIIAAAANFSSSIDIPYVVPNDQSATVWQSALQPSLTGSLSAMPGARLNFVRYPSMQDLADTLVNTMQQEREQGITDAPDAPIIGYSVSSLRASAADNRVDFGFSLLYDSDDSIRAPVTLNAMNVAAQSITANGSTTARQNQGGLNIQTTFSSFPARPEERIFVAAYIVPAFMIYGLSWFMTFFATTQVREREHGHRAHLTSMGIGTRVYLLASAIRDFTFAQLSIVASIVLLAAARVPIFIESSALPWIFIEFFLIIPIIGQAYLLSNMFQKSSTVGATLGIGMAVVVFVPYFIVHFALQNNVSITAISIVAVFLPTFGAERALSDIARSSMRMDSYTSADTFNIHREVFPVLLALVASAIFYTTLAYRADARIQAGKSASLIGTLFKKLFKKRSTDANAAEAPKKTEYVHSDEAADREKDRLQQGLPPVDGQDDAVRLLGLRKQFSTRVGTKTVLDSIWMATRTTECFGYLGPNGAGKTTTLKILTGQLKPTSGTASICGLSIQPYDTNIHSLLGVCPQHDVLWNPLTGREHLRYFARIKGVPNQEVEGAVEELLHALDLVPVADRAASGYSGGNKRRLSLAMACIGNPRVLFLDEPTTGVDVSVRRKIWDYIMKLKQRASVILTTHSMEEAEALCDRIGVMVNGKVQAIGTPQRLKNVYGAGYKLLLKTREPNGAQAVQRILQDSLQARPVQLLGCHLEMECERDPHSDNGPQAAAAMLARVFQLLESARIQHGLVDYSVSQTTLSQVFVSFAERQLVA